MRTLSSVKSSAITARQPSVPNLILVTVQKYKRMELGRPRRSEGWCVFFPSQIGTAKPFNLNLQFDFCEWPWMTGESTLRNSRVAHTLPRCIHGKPWGIQDKFRTLNGEGWATPTSRRDQARS